MVIAVGVMFDGIILCLVFHFSFSWSYESYALPSPHFIHYILSVEISLFTHLSFARFPYFLAHFHSFITTILFLPSLTLPYLTVRHITPISLLASLTLTVFVLHHSFQILNFFIISFRHSFFTFSYLFLCFVPLFSPLSPPSFPFPFFSSFIPSLLSFLSSLYYFLFKLIIPLLLRHIV